MQYSPTSYYFILLQLKYSPQHPVLKHPQSMFFPSCQWPSFTPIKNYRQNYSSVYFNFYVAWEWKQYEEDVCSILFINWNKLRSCSVNSTSQWMPSAALHIFLLQSTSWWICSRLSSVTFAIATVIRAFSFPSVFTLWLHTCPFTQLQRKESKGVRPREWWVYATDPSEKFMFKQLGTMWAKWTCALSRWRTRLLLLMSCRITFQHV
jgi:hypothetical protein